MCSAEATASIAVKALKPARSPTENGGADGQAELSRVLAEIEREGAGALLRGDVHFYEFTKRIFDVVVTVALLVLTMPVMLLTVLAIKVSSRGPVLFRQKRTGRGGRTFTMYKFRSMFEGAEEARPVMEKLNEKDGPIFKIKRDPRVTPVGRFLRRSSIDELPQLINVLAGQMSLVGPRPLPVAEADNVCGAGRLRTTVKPGITCLWQISGRNELTYQQWIHLDLYYIHQRSLFLDLMIFIQTIPAVLCAHGAY